MRELVRRTALGQRIAPAPPVAQNPTRVAKQAVPYPPGEITDVLACLMSQWGSERFGQPIVIENRPGGGINICVAYVVRVAPSRRQDARVRGIAGPCATGKRENPDGSPLSARI